MKRLIYNHRSRLKALLFLCIMMAENLAPLTVLALTGGPSQPEVQSFEPVGTSEMVDLFSGDFNYNIPLLDVNGYPVNIAYHAGASMDQEASWVGLGWNINPGTINRDMRGLPDDMKGENITKEINLKDNWTLGVTAKYGFELFGWEKPKKLLDAENSSLNLGVKYNSYKGLGYEYGLSLQSKSTEKLGFTGGLDLGYSDDGGLSIEPEVSFGKKVEGEVNNTFNIGTSFNSREGLQSFSMGHKLSKKGIEVKDKDKSKHFGKWEKNSGITYSTAPVNYSPGISTPFHNFSISLNFKPGGLEAMGLHGHAAFDGYFSNQYIPDWRKTESKPGYGYLYEQEANRYDEVEITNTQYKHNRSQIEKLDYLYDFNRQNDGPLNEVNPYLGWVNHTYDVYNVSAQGVGGMYRLHRNDIPMLHDDFRATKSEGYRVGIELGGGNLYKGGLNLGANWTKSISGFWSETNHLKEKIGFLNRYEVNALVNEPQYEPVYFREVNELVPQNSTYLAKVGDERPVRPTLRGKDLNDFLAGHNASDPNVNYASDKGNNASMDRTHRNKMMTYLTTADKDLCLDKSIKSIALNSKNFTDGHLADYTLIQRDRNANHITEISILNTDGSRHIFGIPAYNTEQKEKSFRVSNSGSTHSANGIVQYNSEGNHPDNSLRNNKGIDQYYSSVSTPPYAHSYLLTGVLSPDYIDLTGNGISDDDFGSAVKFNYSRVHADYQWRAPYNTNIAKFDKGNQSDPSDDAGHYSYGKKEIWHLHSIEGKTHIAIFTVSARTDGLGVIGENGGKNVNDTCYKLDKIELFSKRELKEYGSSAVPIKTVHFKYNYSLCKGIDNQVSQSNGKLTLVEIYFTYGKSNKGRFNSYKFEYNDHSDVKYHLLAYDRWGTYSTPRTGATNDPTNAEFPYTTQNQDSANFFAAIWNLKKIELPSGGIINVDYEADDYAFVQDKRAMRMFKIKAIGRIDDEDGLVQESQLYSNNEVNDILFFELDDPLPMTDIGKKRLRSEYLEGVNHLQATVYTQITGSNYEYIKSYLTPHKVNDEYDCGITDGGNTGWVRINYEHMRDEERGDEINPIAKAGWQYTRMNLNYLINPTSEPKKSGIGYIPEVSLLIGFIPELISMFTGPNKALRIRNFCRYFDSEKSWVRLNDPDKIKIGGGHRVKKVYISDEWEDINSEDANAVTSTYGQEYDYKTTLNDSNQTLISSGVATYEPMIGRDENPWVQPVFYDQKRKGVPDSRYTFEEPVGESFFPGASVGYSKVTVKSIEHVGQAKMHRTGSQVSEFYTYKDFPVIVMASAIEKNITKRPKSFSAYSIGVSSKVGAAAQGFTVYLNDMHGKPKSNWSFNENEDKLSGVQYIYKIDSATNTLNNSVLAIQPNGDISTKKFGVNVDFATDARYAEDRFHSLNVDINLDVFAAGLLPIFVPGLIPTYNFSNTITRTATSIKIVRKTGLLQKTIAYKEGSSITTENLLYDGITGDVLLTSVENEFNDTIFSFKYPAHWAYDKGMGEAFQNWGLQIRGLEFDDGVMTSYFEGDGINLKDYFVPGDFCIFYSEYNFSNGYGYTDGIPVWVNYDSNGDLILINEKGTLLYSDLSASLPYGSLRIIRSGRKNMANLEIGSITCKSNPIKSAGGGNYYLDFRDVLATSAVEYKDEWRTDYSILPRVECDTLPFRGLLKELIKATVADSGFFNQYYYQQTNFCQQLYYGTKISPNFYTTSDALEWYMEQLPYDLLFLLGLNTSYEKYYSWATDCGGVDTCGLNAYCRYRLTDSLYRKSGSNYYSIQNQTLDVSVLEFDLDLTDSVYVYDSITSQFVGIKDINLFNSLPELTHNRKTKSGNSNVDLTIRSSLLDSLNDVLGLDSCDPNSLELSVGLPTDDTTGFNIYIVSQDCEMAACNSEGLYISTGGIKVKNILQILQDSIINDSLLLLQARVQLHTGGYDTIPITANTGCLKLLDCTNICKLEAQARRVNPFLTGQRGNWRPYKSWTYVEDRVYDITRANPKTDGAFESFTEFWTYNDTSYVATYDNPKWVWTSEVTDYSPFGMELENMDPLGRFSAALYGYGQTLPVAVASNTRYRQLWFEGFEEYIYQKTIMSEYICPPWLFPYNSEQTMPAEFPDNLEDSISHSGYMCLKLSSGDSLVQEIALKPSWVNNVPNIRTGKEFITTEDDQIIPFRPTPGAYIIGAWIREANAMDTTFETSFIAFEFTGDNGFIQSDTFRPDGLIIEGWQRVEQVFNVSDSASVLKIKYLTQGTNGWFDDIRIFPYSGNMKSYVYDHRTLRLMAELDENNYATFYEYDLEGNLISIKKETERGIKTLQESRQHQKANQ